MAKLVLDKNCEQELDYGKKGRKKFEICNYEMNGVYKKATVTPVYLCLDGNYKYVKLKVIPEPNSVPVKISLDRKNWSEEIMLQGEFEKEVKRIYFKYDEGYLSFILDLEYIKQH